MLVSCELHVSDGANGFASKQQHRSRLLPTHSVDINRAETRYRHPGPIKRTDVTDHLALEHLRCLDPRTQHTLMSSEQRGRECLRIDRILGTHADQRLDVLGVRADQPLRANAPSATNRGCRLRNLLRGVSSPPDSRVAVVTDASQGIGAGFVAAFRHVGHRGCGHVTFHQRFGGARFCNTPGRYRCACLRRRMA